MRHSIRVVSDDLSISDGVFVSGKCLQAVPDLPVPPRFRKDHSDSTFLSFRRDVRDEYDVPHAAFISDGKKVLVPFNPIVGMFNLIHPWRRGFRGLIDKSKYATHKTAYIVPILPRTSKNPPHAGFQAFTYHLHKVAETCL